jgi:4-amino-4-deoxy-L-arabinose transferase-like glycosyltransferase
MSRATLAAALLIGALTVFRFFYALYPGVLPDEAYYWLWSRHLDASYYSKGPAVAYTIAFGTWVLGDGPLGLRWISVLLAAGTGWQLFLLARRFYGDAVGLGVVVTAAVIPILAVGSVLMTIDPLAVFFWVWGANLFLDALAHGGGFRWALVGLAAGAGFLAKYIHVLELICFALFLLWSPAYRRRLLDPGWWIALGVFSFCTIPVIWWNSQHGWISASHVASHAATHGENRFHWGEFVEFLSMQALVISPVLFLLILAAGVAVLLRRGKTDAERFLLSLWAPIFGMYVVLSFNDAGEANWPVISYVGALPLAVAFWLPLARRSLAARAAIGIGLAIGLIITVALHETRWLNLPPKKDPMNRTRGWTSFAQRVEQARRTTGAEILIGDRYQTAALMAYYLPDHPPTFNVPSADPTKKNQFSFWPGYTLDPAAPVLYVTESIDRFPHELEAQLTSRRLVDDFFTEENGRPIKRYQIWVGQPRAAQP